MDAQVKVEGLRELTGSLRRISRELPKEIRAINLRRAERVAQRSKQRGPKRTGRLTGSVRGLATQRNARVAVGRASMPPYPPVIYWGWPGHNIEPNQFIDRAMTDLKSETQREFEQEVDQFVRGVWSQWRP